MRDESVTITKALGIMLMVLAHSGFSYIGDAAINMFHMPLFFFMSGYCFSDSHLASPKKFFYGKIKRIYFPYLKYSFLFLLLHNVFYSLHFYSNGIYSFHDIIFRGLHIAVSMGMHDQLLGGYWFMGNLFWGLVIAYTLLKLCGNNATVGIVITLVVSIIMNYWGIHLPIIQVYFSDFFSAAFILIGVLYKRKKWEYEQNANFILPLAFLLVVLGTIYWRGCVPIINAWKILPYYITAVVGTLAVFCVAKRIVYGCCKTQILNKIGGGTLAILTWHFLCFKFVSWLIVLVYNLPIEMLAEFPVIYEYASKGWWIAYFLIGVLLPLGIDCFISFSRNYLKQYKSIL